MEMTYLEQAALWSDFVSDATLVLFGLCLGLLLIRVALNNRVVFKILMFVLFAIPILLSEVFSYLRG